MPGILGIIAKKPFRNWEKELHDMVQCMMHEPFYESNIYIDTDMGYYIAGVSLKGSLSNCLPVYNEKGDLVLFFSGECFGYEDVANDLKSRGHQFNMGDFSYLIHLYEELGESFVTGLNGWFSGIILDYQQRKALLFNDRYGLKKIYYYENEYAFFFSSEAKSLLKIMPWLRSFDLRSLGEYFVFDCVLENRTYFPDVFLLPTGSAWIFTNGQVRKGSYFDSASWENQPVLDGKLFLEKLRQILVKVVPRYSNDNLIGMSLTGGVDTRIIMAFSNTSPRKMPCYTFGGLYRDSLDVRIARRVAQACSQSHNVIPVDKKFLTEFFAHAFKTVFITDGLADVCESHEIYLNGFARQIAPIRLTGKYGSQVRGASMLRDRSPDERLFSRGFLKNILRARENFAEISRVHNLSFVLFEEIPWYWGGVLAAESSQLTVRSPYLDNDLIALQYQAPTIGCGDYELLTRVIAPLNQELAIIRTNRGIGGKNFIPISKLVGSAWFIVNIFDQFYNWDRMPHFIAKLDKAFSFLHIENLLLGYDQLCHYRKWFRDDIADCLKEILLDSRTLERPYWNKSFLRQAVLDHTTGRGNYLAELKKALTVELIHRTLLDEL